MRRLMTVEHTAWTRNNAGRRLVSCVNGAGGFKCFCWVDRPICARGWIVIGGLLRRIGRSEAFHEQKMET